MANLEMEELRLIGAVRTAMNEKGMKQTQLAEAVGASSGTISAGLSGVQRMSAGRWRKICEELGLDYDAIVCAPDDALVQTEPVEAAKEEAPEGVLVKAEPEELYKLMTAMYALRDATLALQPGETY